MSTLNKIYDVTAISQSKDNSCWTAAASMLLSWKSGIPISELDVSKQAGPTFENAFNANNPLFGPDIGNFAAALNLATEAPQSLSARGYYDLLVAHGPLWVGTAIFSNTQVYRHIRIVRGIDGDGAADTTALLIIDPDGGRMYDESVQQFETELETIALQDLGPDGQGNLFPQIIRFP
ncbi:papain-like cysteine protease family protein [Nitrobacter sp. JJSN]|uniref:papain-like cysteine protease family protein n=1 Tax=Nitrobacter sp. JJSN TaxID=3453033 RepID=UPI003F774BD3